MRKPKIICPSINYKIQFFNNVGLVLGLMLTQYAINSSKMFFSTIFTRKNKKSKTNIVALSTFGTTSLCIKVFDFET
jgi:hypothetical protein